MNSADRAGTSALSARALVAGTVCVVITCFVVCFAELVVGQIQVGFLQLPPVVVGMLVLILGTQAALTRLSPRLRLAQRELFTIYVMMLLAAMISSRGLLQKLIPLLVVPNYLATSENGWRAKFYPFIKPWTVPFDPKGEPKQIVSTRFYEGLRFGEHIPWHQWVAPMVSWGLFISLIFGAYLCMAVILRRQWVDNEKLAFPLVQLPLEMVRSDAADSFLKRPATWIGFMLPALFFGFNGLHRWYPGIPDIMTDFDLNGIMQNRPWNGVTFFHMYYSMAAVGFFYLLPTDLLFSLWFFFLLTKVEEIGASALGYEPTVMPLSGCKEFIGYQLIGAYFVLAATLIYAARPHLKRVWRCAVSLRQNDEKEDDGELFSYRTAFWGLAICVILAAGWMWLLGMNYWIALFELCVLIFVVALVLARSTCEGGMLMTEISFRPVDVLRMGMDVRDLGGANITCMAFLDGLLMRDMRGLVLTGFLDSMKFADGVRVRRRSLMPVFLIAFALAIIVSGYLHIYLPYHRGAITMYSYVYQGNPVWAFTDAATVLDRSRPPLPMSATVSFGIGALATIALAALRSRLAWFPFHPLGYALSGSWTMMVFWFPCLVAWLCKSLILRYGGKRLYMQCRPFFLGLVLGEFTMAVLWTIPSLFYKTPTPFFPWP